MSVVYRFDTGTLKSPHRTASGYILAEGFASKPGVLIYQNQDGTTRRELVTPEELARVDSLETLARQPITLHHPVGGFVTPDNVGELQVGDIAETIEIDGAGGYVKVRLAVRRADAITAIEGGVTQLSAGYSVELDETPGIHPIFGRYDAIQKNRKYNHLAIVPAGRAGADVSLRADSAFQITPLFEGKKAMSAENVTEAVKAEMKRREDAAEAEALKAEVDSLKAQILKLQAVPAEPVAPVDPIVAEKERADAFMKSFKERADALEVATLANVQGAADMPTSDLKRAVVAAHLGEGMRADASNDYVAAAYDFAKTALQKQKQFQTYNTTPATPRNDAAPVVSAEQAFRDNLNKQLKRG